MNCKSIGLGLGLAALAASIGAPAAADYVPNLALSIGTPGFGAEFTQPVLSRYLSISLQANYFNFSHDFTYNNSQYHGQIRLLTGGALLNAYPFGNGFTISAGVYGNGSRFRADTTQPIETDGPLGVPVEVASHGDVKGTFDKVAPYAGLGWVWGHSVTSALSLGVLFQGGANADAHLDCTTPNCNALAAQDENDIRQKIREYRYYPFLRYTLGFRL